MRSVILHYHIYKNAGMSIEETLDRNFGERFCRLDTDDPNGHVTNDDLLAYLNRNAHVQAISSHQIRYPIPAAPGIFFFDLCFCGTRSTAFDRSMTIPAVSLRRAIR